MSDRSNDRVEAVREEMERERDILRGLGASLSLEDMRAYGERMSEAAVDWDEVRRNEEELAAEQRRFYEEELLPELRANGEV